MESPRVSRELIARWLMDCVIFGLGVLVGISCLRHPEPRALVVLLWLFGGVLTLFVAELVSFPRLVSFMAPLSGVVVFAPAAVEYWRHGHVLSAVIVGLASLGSAIWLLGEIVTRRQHRKSAPVARGPAAS